MRSMPNVQSHSGTQANVAVYMATLQPGDTVLGMNLSHGGQLTHGHPLNFSGRMYKFVAYGVRRDNEQIDYDEIEKLAAEHKPKSRLSRGRSAYSRVIDFSRMAAAAKSVGALFFVDMAHIAGLVAAGVLPSPVPYADLVSSTTHKTLRGPRGGLVLCKTAFAKELDKLTFPGIQGGPLVHTIAAKAEVCLKEAMEPADLRSISSAGGEKRQSFGGSDCEAGAARGFRAGRTIICCWWKYIRAELLEATRRKRWTAQGITVNSECLRRSLDPLPPMKAGAFGSGRLRLLRGV